MTSTMKKREKHGMSNHPLYKRWADMRYRCKNPNHPVYHNYGGRGITVCERWDNSFADFVKDVGRPPFPRAQIDRIDNNGPYILVNIRWATQREQMLNTRRNRLYTIEGITKPRIEWCEEYGMDVSTYRARMRRGWDVLEALTKIPLATGPNVNKKHPNSH
jgi:hypothetical protein